MEGSWGPSIRRDSPWSSAMGRVRAFLQVRVAHGRNAGQVVVPASGAFFCFGTEDTRARTPTPRGSSTGALSAAEGGGRNASDAGLPGSRPTASVVETTRRRLCRRARLYPDDEKMKAPVLRGSSCELTASGTLLVFLHEGGVLFGLAGLEAPRRRGRSSRAEDVQVKIESLGPFVVAGVRTAARVRRAVGREAAALQRVQQG